MSDQPRADERGRHGGGDEPDQGQQLGAVVDRLRELREGDAARRRSRSEGIVLDQLDEVEGRLLAFGRALGGDPDEVSELPFTEEAGMDAMPAALYVRHDPELLNQVTSWLLQDSHIGLVSPYGTGKTAFREILRRDLAEREDFVVAVIDNPQETTPRGLYERVISACFDAGYEIDPTNYWQVRNGIPWATDETKRAVQEVTEAARADGTSVLLIVDELEDVPERLLAPLQVAGDAGVRLFLTGTPRGRKRLANVRATLESRLRYYEGIEPFSPADVAEYVARSLAYFRDEPFEADDGPDLFTPEAILDVHERTGGNPREVRLECRELFTRAAFVWYRTGQDVERVSITPALRHRRFGMGR